MGPFSRLNEDSLMPLEKKETSQTKTKYATRFRGSDPFEYDHD